MKYRELKIRAEQVH